MGGKWKCNFWEDIGNDEEVQGLPETCDGPYGLKSEVSNRFKTILQCVMTKTAMNIVFSKDLHLRVTNMQRMACIKETQLCILDTNGKYFSK